jgi:parallel beta-helix repeat protein
MSLEDKITEYFCKEWRVMKDAPLFFVLTLLIASFATYKAVNWHYSERIELITDERDKNAKEITDLNSQISELRSENKSTLAQSDTTPLDKKTTKTAHTNDRLDHMNCRADDTLCASDVDFSENGIGVNLPYGQKATIHHGNFHGDSVGFQESSPTEEHAAGISMKHSYGSTASDNTIINTNGVGLDADDGENNKIMKNKINNGLSTQDKEDKD